MLSRNVRRGTWGQYGTSRNRERTAFTALAGSRWGRLPTPVAGNIAGRSMVAYSSAERAARYLSASVCGMNSARWYDSMKPGSDDRSWYDVAPARSTASFQRLRLRNAPIAPASDALPRGTKRERGYGGKTPRARAD